MNSRISAVKHLFLSISLHQHSPLQVYVHAYLGINKCDNCHRSERSKDNWTTVVNLLNFGFVQFEFYYESGKFVFLHLV